MHQLSFKITLNQNRYQIYIERNVCHFFNSKREADLYIKKYKSVLTDNLPIILNLHKQLLSLRNQHFQFMSTSIQRQLRFMLNDFEEEFSMIFYNLADENKTAVQFRKIKVCLNILDDIILILQKYARRSKRTVLLNELNGINKIYFLTYRNYINEINGLFVAHGYRGGLRNLNHTENENNLSYKAS